MSFRGTTVTFFRRTDGKWIGFRAVGHFGYADAVAVIVCAAISALTLTTLNGLRNVLKAPVIFEADDQSALVEARLMPEATEDQVVQAQLLLETLLQGLQAIQRDYPRNIRIIFKERR